MQKRAEGRGEGRRETGGGEKSGGGQQVEWRNVGGNKGGKEVGREKGESMF